MVALSRVKLLVFAIGLMVLLVILLSPGCGPATKPAAGEKPAIAEDIDPHGLHELDNARLRSIMHRLAAVRFDEIAAELDATGGAGSNRDLCEVGKLSVELADDARVIPLIFRGTEMNDESRRVLNNLSQRLFVEACGVRKNADANEVWQVKEGLDRMVDTCNACHASFRAPAIAMGPAGDESWTTNP